VLRVDAREIEVAVAARDARARQASAMSGAWLLAAPRGSGWRGTGTCRCSSSTRPIRRSASRCEVRLLDEALDRVDRTRATAAPDVAIARLGLPRHDAEGDELAGLGRRQRRRTAAWKAGDVADHVVRRQHQQQRIARSRQRRLRRERNGRRRIAPDRLEHDGRARRRAGAAARPP
jgi:hypothetical protein